MNIGPLIQNSSIALETRAGRRIENYKGGEYSPLDRKTSEEIREQYRQAKFRTDAIAAYNCHGLSFASRRTWICQASEIHKILEDDRYERISDPRGVLPGDIILYVDPTAGTVEHSGVVVEGCSGHLKIPLVVSKWGKFAEVIHYASYCPYGEYEKRYFRVKS